MPLTLQTADDLARFREPGKTAELVRGVLVVREPPVLKFGCIPGFLRNEWTHAFKVLHD
jgi:hypothetical protein